MRRGLLLNDNQDRRKALAELLEGEGWRVSVAGNGREVCVILLDYMMPVMKGRECHATQRARPDLADIPLVSPPPAPSQELW